MKKKEKKKKQEQKTHQKTYQNSKTPNKIQNQVCLCSFFIDPQYRKTVKELKKGTQ